MQGEQGCGGMRGRGWRGGKKSRAGSSDESAEPARRPNGEEYKFQLKNFQGTNRDLTIKTKQYESQITIFQDDLEKQSIASQQNVENVRKSYESKIKSLEMERDKYESQGIDQEIQIRNSKSKVEHLQQKYEKECGAHQQAGLRKARISLYF